MNCFAHSRVVVSAVVGEVNNRFPRPFFLKEPGNLYYSSLESCGMDSSMGGAKVRPVRRPSLDSRLSRSITHHRWLVPAKIRVKTQSSKLKTQKRPTMKYDVICDW